MTDNTIEPMPPSAVPAARSVPLVLLHGVGQSPIVWQDFVSAFGAGRSLHAPWLPGLKPRDTQRFSLDDAAHGIVRDLQLQGLRQVDILGVSVGASIALRIAATEAGMVRRLVVSSPLVRPTAWALRMQRAAIRVVPESRLVDAGVDRRRMMALINSLKGFDGTEQLSGVAAPTLVVAGARDKAGTAASTALRALLPNGSFETIPGAGAVLNTEAPRELAALAHAHLDVTAS